LYGHGVKKNVRINSPKLVDIAPTVLALAGVAPADDMPGRVLDEVLLISVDRARVATYETGEDGKFEAADTAPVDSAILEHLEALGYLDTASPTGDRNLAALHFEAGRYEEAVAAYRLLVEASPEDGALRASFAGALGALGRTDEAIIQLDEAIRLAPLHPESYHNRGVILERQGRTQEAIASYRNAVRYRPDYEPSRSALVRLTGSATARTTSLTPAEREATAIAERASTAAQRGNYAQADALLDEAVGIAPEYALIYGYRANVAFLRGDKPRAITALQEALRLEPDNALFLQNLRHLQRSTQADGGKAAPFD
jgi:tetratricopeptide (TPR) repeat protein